MGCTDLDDSILRGFCKKCKTHIEWLTKENYTDCPKDFGQCVPVWFLSAKQMEIILESKEFNEWEGRNRLYDNDGDDLPKFLETKPFLVAKILKEAEGENK